MHMYLGTALATALHSTGARADGAVVVGDFMAGYGVIPLGALFVLLLAVTFFLFARREAKRNAARQQDAAHANPDPTHPDESR